MANREITATTRVLFLAIVGVCSILASATWSAGPEPSDRSAALPAAAQHSEAAFDSSAAASSAEDMIDYALAGDTGRVEETLAQLRDRLPAFRQALGADRATTLEQQIAEIGTALERGNLNLVALTANEAFRTIVEAREATGGVPREVSLLDYSGFKLKTLAKADRVDWKTVAAAGDEANGYWSAIAGKVHDRGLRDLVNSIQEGLAQGVAQHDASLMAFAAQMLLDAVDLLENSFA